MLRLCCCLLPLSGALGLSSQAELTIKLSSELAVVDVAAFEKETGKPAAGLGSEDFDLYEDGVRQKITHFSQDSLPLSVVLLMDVSGSMRPVVQALGAGALEALEHLKPEDEVALAAFANRFALVAELTHDRRLIAERIGRAYETARVGKGTLMDRGIRGAADALTRAADPAGRRVVIVVTDNFGQMPRFSGAQEETVAALLEAGVTVSGLIVRNKLSFVIEGLRRGPLAASVAIKSVGVGAYAGPTGGEVMKSDKGEVGRNLADMLERLRTRYTLGYLPSNRRYDGSFRQVRVTLTPEARSRVGDVTVRHRRGYYARPAPPKTARAPLGETRGPRTAG